MQHELYRSDLTRTTHGLQNLGNTGLNVSVLCLGMMTMGWTSDKVESFAVMDYAVDNGINFFDTADVYSRWVEGNDGGVAETQIYRKHRCLREYRNLEV